MRYSSLLVSIILAVMLMVATPMGYNFGATAHAVSSEPSVNDPDLKIDTVADGLKFPTTMAFLDEHRILVLEKNEGTVRLIKDGKLQSKPMLDVAVANDNERGMLGIAVSKENDTTTYVFLYFTESGGGKDGDDGNSISHKAGILPAGNRLYRYELDGDRLLHPKLLLDVTDEPGNPGQDRLSRYVGGPIVIGRDGFVYVIIGDVDHHDTKAENNKDGGPPIGTAGVLRIGKNGEVPSSVI